MRASTGGTGAVQQPSTIPAPSARTRRPQRVIVDRDRLDYTRSFLQAIMAQLPQDRALTVADLQLFHGQLQSLHSPRIFPLNQIMRTLRSNQQGLEQDLGVWCGRIVEAIAVLKQKYSHETAGPAALVVGGAAVIDPWQSIDDALTRCQQRIVSRVASSLIPQKTKAQDVSELVQKAGMFLLGLALVSAVASFMLMVNVARGYCGRDRPTESTQRRPHS